MGNITEMMGGVMPLMQPGLRTFRREWDISAPPDPFPDALPEDLIEALRNRAARMSEGLGGIVNRQKALGLSRARGASGTPAQVAAQRNVRKRALSTLDKLLSLARERKAKSEFSKVTDAIKMVSERQRMMSEWATRMKRMELEEAKIRANIAHEEVASVSRGAFSLGTTALSLALPFMGGSKATGAIVGAGVGTTQMLSAGEVPGNMVEVSPQTKAWRTQGPESGYLLDFPGSYMKEPTAAKANMADTDTLEFDLWRSANPEKYAWKGNILNFDF